MRSRRGRIPLLALAVLSTAASACSTTSTWVSGPANVAYDSTGAPRLVAPRWITHNYFIEGNSGPDDLWFAARSADGSWQQSMTSPGAFQSSVGANAGHIASGTNGRDYLVGQSTRSIAILTRTTGSWLSIVVDPSVPPEALQSSSTSPEVTDVVNTGWTGSDGLTRFVVRQSLLEFDGDQLVRAIPIPRDLSRTILRKRNADVVPTGDRTAELTLFESVGGSQMRVHLGSLQCTGTECVVNERTSDNFIGIEGPREIHTAMTFHLTDGTPVQACTYAPFAGGHIDIEVSSPGRERLLIENAELVGAGPRPDGGFVVVTRPPEANGDPVLVFAIDGAGNERRIQLGPRWERDYYSFGIAPGSSDVFDVFDASGGEVTRIRVDAGTGSVARERVVLE